MKFYYADGMVLSEKLKEELLKKKEIFYCDNCKEYHWSDEVSIINIDGHTMCTVAYANRYRICNCCGKSYDLRSNRFTQGMCMSCFEANKEYQIHSYGHQPTQKFYGDDGNFTTTPPSDYDGFGIELEVDGSGEYCQASKRTQENLNHEVYIKHDGSLRNGFEIITFPHTEKSFFNMNWKHTFSDLIKSKYRSHDIKTCGLHMHCSRTHLDTNALTRLVYFYEHFRDDVMKFSRRDSDEANRWAAGYGLSGKTKLSDCRSVVGHYNKSHDHDERYHCVNLINENTVEIRIMRGTLNYKTFMATCDFLITIFKNCRKEFKDLNNLEEWFEGLKPETYEYMKVRNCFGYSSKNKVEERDLDVHNRI